MFLAVCLFVPVVDLLGTLTTSRYKSLLAGPRLLKTLILYGSPDYGTIYHSLRVRGLETLSLFRKNIIKYYYQKFEDHLDI